MSDNQDALRLADAIDSDFDPDWMNESGYDEIAAELRRLVAENEALKAELAEQARLNAELVEALRGTYAELLSVLDALNNERMPFDGDEFHERLGRARAALAKVEASK